MQIVVDRTSNDQHSLSKISNKIIIQQCWFDYEQPLYKSQLMIALDQFQTFVKLHEFSLKLFNWRSLLLMFYSLISMRYFVFWNCSINWKTSKWKQSMLWNAIEDFGLSHLVLFFLIIILSKVDKSSNSSGNLLVK